jgi:DNA-binding PadR family transcriptional regulator
MIRDITNKFEKAMKKGFMSTLCLIVLNKEPMHGRQIKKAIKERTFNVWEPSDSTIYTILKNLKEQNLIKDSHKDIENEKTNFYEITDKGKDALEIMLRKEQELRESMSSLLLSTFGIKEDMLKSDFHGPNKVKPSIFGMTNFSNENITGKEKLESLMNMKKFLEIRIKIFKKKLQNIEEKISQIEEKPKYSQKYKGIKNVRNSY